MIVGTGETDRSKQIVCLCIVGGPFLLTRRRRSEEVGLNAASCDWYNQMMCRTHVAVSRYRVEAGTGSDVVNVPVPL